MVPSFEDLLFLSFAIDFIHTRMWWPMDSLQTDLWFIIFNKKDAKWHYRQVFPLMNKGNISFWKKVNLGPRLMPAQVQMPNAHPDIAILKDRIFPWKNLSNKQEFRGRRHRTCWRKSHRSHNQNVVIK